MRYSFESDMAKVRGDWDSRDSALSRSLSLEICAATLLMERLDCEPTRSILFRSAATLAMRSGEFGCAMELAQIGLEGNPCCEAGELARIIADARAGDGSRYGCGKSGRSFPEGRAEVRFSIAGEG